MLKHPRRARRLTASAAIGLMLALASCATPETPGMATAAKPIEAAPAPTASAALPSGVTAALIASGDAVFHGSSCIACHGEDAKGTAVGPNLADATWLTGDGSLAAITEIVSQGVDEPKQFRSPMPALGGAGLSDDDLKAVAAYVWSLSHR